MKKRKYLLSLLLTMFISPLMVNAAGTASLSVNKGTIENGSSVTATVTIKNAAAWNIFIKSTGATSGCSQKFSDVTSNGQNTAKSFSVTCKSTSTGTINFTMSGDITSADRSTTSLSGSKSVTVTVPRPKSTNNKLKGLEVEGYEISPAFSDDVKEYSVTVPSTIESINVKATKADSYASVEGAGQHTVESGANTIEVIVTSETGVSNSYKIVVNVEDLNPIEVTVDKQKYTVVKEAKNLVKPELFEETTVKIGEFDIPAFTNALSKYTLVGLKDTEGAISLFIYKSNKYTKYIEFSNFKITLSLLDMPKIPKGYTKRTIKIDEQKVTAYEIKNSNLYLVYALNILTGKKNYYSYDTNEKTFQLFNLNNYNDSLDTLNLYKYISYGLGAGIILLLVVIVLESNGKRKMKKMILLKETSKEEIKKDKQKNSKE